MNCDQINLCFSHFLLLFKQAFCQQNDRFDSMIRHGTVAQHGSTAKEQGTEARDGGTALRHGIKSLHKGLSQQHESRIFSAQLVTPDCRGQLITAKTPACAPRTLFAIFFKSTFLLVLILYNKTASRSSLFVFVAKQLAYLRLSSNVTYFFGKKAVMRSRQTIISHVKCINMYSATRLYGTVRGRPISRKTI